MSTSSTIYRWSCSLGILACFAGSVFADDQEKLQGRWRIESVAVQEQTVAREDRPASWKATFDTDVTINGDRFTHAQAAKEAAVIKLDETREPKQITLLSDDGKLKFRGIYRLLDDEITVCINGDGTDVRRPEEFVTKKGTPLVLLKLKKATAAR